VSHFIAFEQKLNPRENSRRRPINLNLIEFQNDSERQKILSYHSALLYDAYVGGKNAGNN
jgi:predicted component of type VI protein secretion system